MTVDVANQQQTEMTEKIEMVVSDKPDTDAGEQSVGGTDCVKAEVQQAEGQESGANSTYLNPVSNVQEIPLVQICLADRYRFRLLDDEETIERYADMYRQYLEDSKTEFCPLGAIHVLRVEDKWILPNGAVLRDDYEYLVAAGRLRYFAAKKAGMQKLPCIVLTDHEEAMKVGLGSNKHGLRLKRGDVKRCIEIAVNVFPDKSSRWLADLIGCDESHVRRIIKNGGLRTSPHVKGKDGKTYSSRKEPCKPIRVDEDTADRTEVPIDRLLGELRTALKVTQEGDQRARALTEFVETLMRDSFTEDNGTVIRHRQAFVRRLGLMLEGFWTVPRNSFYATWMR